MSAAFLNRIEEDLKVPLFTDDDLRLVFRDKEPSAIYNSLTYHLKNHNLERYRRGLYSLSIKRGRKYNFSKFKLANKLVLHSYISFESALSHHNIIPEAVYEVTSATLSKNVVFENSLGRFSFSYSPVEPFYLGVEKDEITGAKVANPIRALFDLIYTRRKLYDNAENLESDLRVDLKEFKAQLSQFKPGDILELGELYKKRTTRVLAMILVRDLM
jgi:predicted transcriptional regulator of viral defense system